MEMTHVIRGEDHISNTPRQILLVRGDGISRRRCSRTCRWSWVPITARCRSATGATSVSEFRAKGYSAGGARQLSGADRMVAGARRRALLPIDELARRFSLEGRRPQRRCVRRGEAGVGEPALPEDWRTRRGLPIDRYRFSATPACRVGPDDSARAFLVVRHRDGVSRPSIGSKQVPKRLCVSVRLRRGGRR